MPSPNTSSPVVYSTLTGNNTIDLLIYGMQWANTNISYSFIVPGISYFSASYPDTSLFQNIQALSLAQQNAFNSALSAWSNVAAINFVQSADNSTTVGDIRVAFSWSTSATTANEAAFTYLPSTNPAGGDIWINPTANDSLGGYANGTFAYSNFQQGSYAYYTLLHELGHAIGLKHPFETSPYNTDAVTPAGTGWDSRSYTLMSYTTLSGHPDAIGFSFNPTTPMVLDIAAIQSMYGANYAFNAGATTYSFNDNPGQHYFQTIWDGGGNNAISYSGNTSSVIDLRPGYGSTIGNPVYAETATNPNAYLVNNVWIAYGTHIDTAVVTGYGNNTLQANNDGDTLIGGSGNDTFIGGTGNDTFKAGSGNDTINGGGGTNTCIFAGNSLQYNILLGTENSAVVSDAIAGFNVSDTLTNIQRLHFADTNIAIDINGNAGTTAMILGAVFGAASEANKQYVGIGLSLLDGGMSSQNLTTLALNAELGAGFSNAAEINLLYQNLVGSLPSASDLNYWTGTLTSGQYTQTSLAVMAENTSLNATNIHLIGLHQTGIQYA